MPKLPQHTSRPPLVTPLAAMKLKPVFVDRSGATVRLRTLKPTEVTAEVAGWLTDPQIMEGLNAPQEAMGLEAFRAYAASFDNLRRSLIAIRERQTDRPIGLLFLDVDLRHKLGSAHIAIGSEDDRKLGSAIEAVQLLIIHFFLEREMGKLTFAPLARNRAAIAACRLGFLRQEGELKQHRIDGRTGERLDQLLFAITVEEVKERARAFREPPVFDGPELRRDWLRDRMIGLGWEPKSP